MSERLGRPGFDQFIKHVELFLGAGAPRFNCIQIAHRFILPSSIWHNKREFLNELEVPAVSKARYIRCP